jgi:hypothetical protein
MTWINCVFTEYLAEVGIMAFLVSKNFSSCTFSSIQTKAFVITSTKNEGHSSFLFVKAALHCVRF